MNVAGKDGFLLIFTAICEVRAQYRPQVVRTRLSRFLEQPLPPRNRRTSLRARRREPLCI